MIPENWVLRRRWRQPLCSSASEIRSPLFWRSLRPKVSEWPSCHSKGTSASSPFRYPHTVTLQFSRIHWIIQYLQYSHIPASSIITKLCYRFLAFIIIIIIIATTTATTTTTSILSALLSTFNSIRNRHSYFAPWVVWQYSPCSSSLSPSLAAAGPWRESPPIEIS